MTMSINILQMINYLLGVIYSVGYLCLMDVKGNTVSGVESRDSCMRKSTGNYNSSFQNLAIHV